MAQILIADDQEAYGTWLMALVRGMGHEAVAVPTIREALAEVRARAYDIAFLDVHFPEGSSLEAIPEFRRTGSSPEVVVMTAHADTDGAELAIRSGAWDYIDKKVSADVFKLAIIRALRYREQKLAAGALRPFDRGRLVGASASFNACIELAAQAARYDANVLITGETGTGKELLARAIHDNSPRGRGAFVIVDCAALPENLIESVLFGHEKGAFTGADARTDGLVMHAHEGSLLLDEVGELPLLVQAKFLRILQERRFRRVGGHTELFSNFRLIATTNRDLDAMVAQGRFRADLLHRLRAFPIHLPPLRDRDGDLTPLVLHETARICQRFGMEIVSCSPEFLAQLGAYNWPGNVRELVHVLEQAVSRCEGGTLFGVHLPPNLRRPVLTESAVAPGVSRDREPAPLPEPTLGTFHEAIAEAKRHAEKAYLTRLVALHGFDIAACCRTSDLSRPRLYALLNQHGLHRWRG